MSDPNGDGVKRFGAFRANLRTNPPSANSDLGYVHVVLLDDHAAALDEAKAGTKAAEARVAELEEWVSLIRTLASEYSGNMKLSKAIDRADAAFRSTEPQPAEYVGSERHEYSGRLNPVYKIDMNRRIERPAAESEAMADGCGAYIGGYCGDDGQLCGACVFDAESDPHPDTVRMNYLEGYYNGDTLRRRFAQNWRDAIDENIATSPNGFDAAREGNIDG